MTVFIVTDSRNGEIIIATCDMDAAKDVWHQSIYYRIFAREVAK